MRFDHVRALRNAVHARATRRSNPWYVCFVAALATLAVSLWYAPRTQPLHTATVRVTLTPDAQTAAMLNEPELRTRLLSNQRLRDLLAEQPALRSPRSPVASSLSDDLEIIRRAVEVHVAGGDHMRVTLQVTGYVAEWAEAWSRALADELVRLKPEPVLPRAAQQGGSAVSALAEARRDELAARRLLDASIEQQLAEIAAQSTSGTEMPEPELRPAADDTDKLAAGRQSEATRIATELERLRSRRDELLKTRTAQHPELIQLELDMHVLTRRGKQMSTDVPQPPSHETSNAVSTPFSSDVQLDHLQQLRVAYEQAAARRLEMERAAADERAEQGEAAGPLLGSVTSLGTRRNPAGATAPGVAGLILFAAAAVGLTAGWLTWLARPHRFLSDAGEAALLLGLRIAGRVPSQSPIVYPRPRLLLGRAVQAIGWGGELIVALAILSALVQAVGAAEVVGPSGLGWQVRQTANAPGTTATSETLPR